jgi:hypothetical protein
MKRVKYSLGSALSPVMLIHAGRIVAPLAHDATNLLGLAHSPVYSTMHVFLRGLAPYSHNSTRELGGAFQHYLLCSKLRFSRRPLPAFRSVVHAVADETHNIGSHPRTPTDLIHVLHLLAADTLSQGWAVCLAEFMSSHVLESSSKQFAVFETWAQDHRP